MKTETVGRNDGDKTMERINFIATASFGLESSLKREVLRLGFSDVHTFDGRVEFSGTEEDIVKANLWLRCASKVLIKMGAFRATSFEDLFEGTKALPWGEWITEDGKFTVLGKSVKSQLHSVPDCQAIVKKAVVEKLKQKYPVSWFNETGAEYTIQVSIHNDVAMLTLDTSGQSLHKRGYRAEAMTAPLKETLAAGLIDLSYWNKSRPLLDPLCGSGTIPIEAAMIARNVAPGLRRCFASEQWPRVGQERWKAGRVAAYQAIRYDVMPQIYGSDMSQEAIDLARENAEKAGVDDCITFTVCRAEEARLVGDYGCIITNPPYGERIGEVKEVEALYRSLGALLRQNATWGAYVITSMEYFESLFGRRADAKRKIFNGRIKTDYYQFYGPKPPKQKAHPATETK